MDLGAFSISLTVKDLAASRAFNEKLGFAVFGDGPDQKWWILKSGTTVINPGWDADAKKVRAFTDVREPQRQFEAQGVAFTTKADPATTGPAHFVVEDPDGHPILVDRRR